MIMMEPEIRPAFRRAVLTRSGPSYGGTEVQEGCEEGTRKTHGRRKTVDGMGGACKLGIW